MPQPEQLPGPNADIWNWQLQGLCRGMDSSMFFHPDGERGRARTQREQRAKEMCRRCPVIEACRSHALEVGEPYGVWGGLSESERDLLLKGTMGRTRGIRRTAFASADRSSVRVPVVMVVIFCLGRLVDHDRLGGEYHPGNR